MAMAGDVLRSCGSRPCQDRRIVQAEYRWAGFGLAARDGVLEPVALAIHLQDMEMMGEAIEKSPCQTFVAKDPCPLVEW